ncbi:hypothetical protein L1787_25095 [Acuticoccus sp. M5D2P5]|uniref:anti-sigma factor family protein n=1 Tax=Acuticoccus kalidii TaxID=2910977 RepID=UPI001F3708E0|nr:hypothetical protein [Acuticoccus kalidii]MCF3936672.1 hypothetical protein [Acuticoccus kalidii]
MTENRDSIAEIDLLAYADGRLAGDPVRRAAVERHLARDREAARLVADIEAQNAQIRALYDRVLDAPIPERHRDALWGNAERGGGAWMRLAASVALFALAAAGGAAVGYHARDGIDVPSSLIERAATITPAEAGDATFALASTGRERVAGETVNLSFAMPDLSAFGYRLVARGHPDPGAPNLVRFLYRGVEGKEVSLFMRPRMDPGEERVSTRTVGDVAVSYWSAGPVAVAMRTDDPQMDGIAVAKVLKHAVDFARVSVPGPLDEAAPLDGTGAQMAVEAEAGTMLTDIHAGPSQLQ